MMTGTKMKVETKTSSELQIAVGNGNESSDENPLQTPIEMH